MTKDEAILILRNEQPHCGGKYRFVEEQRYEAYEMAIKSLEQQTCEDAISRQVAIDAMYALCDTGETLKENPWRDNPHIDAVVETIEQLPSVNPQPKTEWIPVSERLPKTDNENSINSFNVLLWVKNKTHPEREAQIYLGKLMHVDGDDGSGNFWGIETKPCDWTIWGWSYINEPEVIAWMPLPKRYEPQESEA